MNHRHPANRSPAALWRRCSSPSAPGLASPLRWHIVRPRSPLKKRVEIRFTPPRRVTIANDTQLLGFNTAGIWGLHLYEVFPMQHVNSPSIPTVTSSPLPHLSTLPSWGRSPQKSIGLFYEYKNTTLIDSQRKVLPAKDSGLRV